MMIGHGRLVVVYTTLTTTLTIWPGNQRMNQVNFGLTRTIGHRRLVVVYTLLESEDVPMMIGHRRLVVVYTLLENEDVPKAVRTARQS